MFFITIFLAALLFIFPAPALAGKNQVITIINPIRDRHLWINQKLTPLKNQYQAVAGRRLPATWLIQYDALFDQELIDEIKKFNSSQEIGLFLEVSEKLASDTGTPYQTAVGDWAWPNKVYLSGYSVSDRKKMLDRAYLQFEKVFAYSPKVAGAWHVDPYSLDYLVNKYQLKATIGVSDQFDTDNNHQWGQYFAYPYYPSKYNALKPAQNLQEKLNLVKIQWAQRDPLLSYGIKPYYSNFSLQANDYVSQHNLTTAYFIQLLKTHLTASPRLTQATIGLEVGQEGFRFLEEFINQLDHIQELNRQGVNILTLSQFASVYKSTYPQLSPQVVITGRHHAGSLENQLKQAVSIWFMSPRLRAKLLFLEGQTFLQDLRIYPQNYPAIDLFSPQTAVRISRDFPAVIDHLTSNDQISVDWEANSPLTEAAFLSLVPNDYRLSSLPYLYTRLAGIYENVKALAYTNLSHYRFSSLDGHAVIGIAINPQTLFPHRQTFSPQTLAHFKNLGALINKLPHL